MPPNDYTPQEKREAIELAKEALQDKYLAYCDYFDPNQETKSKIDKKYNDILAILESLKGEIHDNST